MSKKPLFPQLGGLLHGGDYNPDQWLDCPDILAQDIEYMKKAGINCVSLGIFSWASYEPREDEYHFEWLQKVMDSLYANGIYTILATPSGAKPAWLDRKYPDCLRVDNMGIRYHHGDRHNYCMSSENFRRRLKKINSLLAERFARHPALLMWHISNEMGGECFCPLCQQKFTEYLKDKFDNDIEKLNKAWWTTFWSHKYSCFEEIEPPFANGSVDIMGLMLEWRRFTTWNMIDCMKSEIETVKSFNPDIPVTANLMNMYNGLDYRALAKEIDVVSWDSYPRFHNDWESFEDTMREFAYSHAVFRGLKKDKPFMLMEGTPSLTNWQSYNKLKRPGVLRLQAVQAVATGSDTVQYFQIRKSRGSFEQFHGAVIDHAGIDNRVFREVSEVGGILKKLSAVAGTKVKAQAAILFDWDNRWAIQDMQAMCVADKKYEKTLVDFWRELNRCGTEVDVISSLDDFSGYRVIIAPMLYVLHPDVAQRLAEFVKNGGQLMATYLCGYVNENLLCHLGGFPGDNLSQLFGIYSEEMDTLFPSDRNGIQLRGCENVMEVFDCCEILKVTDAEVIGRYTDDFYKDSAAITVKCTGEGSAYYVAARTKAADLAPIFRQMLINAGITPKVVPPLVEYHKREADGEVYEFYLNLSEQENRVEDVYGFDLVAEKEVCGTLKLDGRGVAVVKR
ncbi:MAG: beta-galactosidase [Oscillospiraceae bacterium]|nr:beta-galactosidase [Oscillospiraceae bacterium]